MKTGETQLKDIESRFNLRMGKAEKIAKSISILKVPNAGIRE